MCVLVDEGYGGYCVVVCCWRCEVVDLGWYFGGVIVLVWCCVRGSVGIVVVGFDYG